MLLVGWFCLFVWFCLVFFFSSFISFFLQLCLLVTACCLLYYFDLFIIYFIFLNICIFSSIFISSFCATLHQRSKDIFYFMSHCLWHLLISIWSGSSKFYFMWFYLIIWSVIDFLFMLLQVFLKILCSIDFLKCGFFFSSRLYTIRRNGWLLNHDIR